MPGSETRGPEVLGAPWKERTNGLSPPLFRVISGMSEGYDRMFTAALSWNCRRVSAGSSGAPRRRPTRRPRSRRRRQHRSPPLAAAGDPADDRAEAGAAGHLAAGLLAFTPALRLDVRVVTWWTMPPKLMAFSFSVILSLPFILPDCSTLTACSIADAPRGITIEPSIITGSSTMRLEAHARLRASTSMA